MILVLVDELLQTALYGRRIENINIKNKFFLKIGICSDIRAGKTHEDAPIHEREVPVTTDPSKLSGIPHHGADGVSPSNAKSEILER